MPDDWAEAAARILAVGVRRAVVLGSADMGKSTFCRFLIDEARRTGRTAALLDADIGQKTVGPPACVTLAEERGTRLVFVGATNPIQGWRRTIEGVRTLARDAEADLMITNTSGVVVGAGRRLKAAKIAVIRPDLLIAIGSAADVEPVLSDHSDVTVMRLSRSPHARQKTKGARRGARREAFQRYFAEASVRICERAALDPDRDYPLGILLGLGDRSGEAGLGILVGYPSATTIAVSTPVRGCIDRIEPGLLCLDQSFREHAAPIIMRPRQS